jgi:hypothetical protein
MLLEKNIPLPNCNLNYQFPFDQMEIGDSFVASKDRDEFPEIVDQLIKRNNAGDDLLLYWHCQFKGDPHMRVWRVSVDDYLNLCEEEDKALLIVLFAIIEDLGGGCTHTQLMTHKQNEHPGSRNDRKRIFERFKFLFNATKQKTTGGGVRITVKK